MRTPMPQGDSLPQKDWNFDGFQQGNDLSSRVGMTWSNGADRASIRGRLASLARMPDKLSRVKSDTSKHFIILSATICLFNFISYIVDK